MSQMVVEKSLRMFFLMKFIKIVFYEIQKEKENRPDDYYYYCEQAKDQEKIKVLKFFRGKGSEYIYIILFAIEQELVVITFAII